MNNQENPDPLETELRQFQPTNLSPSFSARLTQSLAISNGRPIPHSPSPFADRCLLTAISLGALAACLIVTVTVSDFRNAPPSVSSPIARQSGDQPQSLADYRQTLAQLDSDADLFRRPR